MGRSDKHVLLHFQVEFAFSNGRGKTNQGLDPDSLLLSLTNRGRGKTGGSIRLVLDLLSQRHSSPTRRRFLYVHIRARAKFVRAACRHHIVLRKVAEDFNQVAHRDAALHINPFNGSIANSHHEGSFSGYGDG